MNCTTIAGLPIHHGTFIGVFGKYMVILSMRVLDTLVSENLKDHGNLFPVTCRFVVRFVRLIVPLPWESLYPPSVDFVTGHLRYVFALIRNHRVVAFKYCSFVAV